MKAQAEMGVGGLIALLVLIAIGALVLYEVTDVASTTAEGQRISSTSQLLNTTITDNTGEIPDDWDNTAISDNSSALWENVSGNFVLSDNVDNQGILEWYQPVTVGDSDGVSSARIVAKYQLSDNSSLDNLQIRVVLDDGTDNNVILLVDNTLHAADNDVWYTVDNDVTSYITSTGVYYLRLWDNTERANAGENLISVRWDNANLSVVTYDKGYAENAIGNVEEKAETVFNLLTILAIVIVAALIIGVVMRAIGGIGGLGGRPAATPAF